MTKREIAHYDLLSTKAWRENPDEPRLEARSITFKVLELKSISFFILLGFYAVSTLIQLYHGDSSLIHDPWANKPVMCSTMTVDENVSCIESYKFI